MNIENCNLKNYLIATKMRSSFYQSRNTLNQYSKFITILFLNFNKEYFSLEILILGIFIKCLVHGRAFNQDLLSKVNDVIYFYVFFYILLYNYDKNTNLYKKGYLN